MRRSTRPLTTGGVYAATLEKLVPALERRLCVWLARLESKVAVQEARYGFASEENSVRPQKIGRGAKADLDTGKPSVIVLGARLKSDRRFCQGLIERVAAVFHGQQPATRRDTKKHARVSRLSEYCQK